MLKNIRLQNIGIHEDLSLDLNNKSVGIIGKSGSGKSTVMESIAFAITGNYPDKNSSWIRMGSEKGIVTLNFSKSGNDYEIKREINIKGTGKRLLVDNTNNKKYEKSSDIDSKLAEIFGANIKSKANTAFIKQGTIGNIVSSTEAERMDILMDLLDLHYLEKQSRIVGDFLKSYKVEDSRPALSYIDNVIKDKNEELEDIVNSMNNIKDSYDLFIKYLDNRSTLESRDRLINELKSKKEDKEYNEKEIEKIVQSMGGIDCSIESLENKVKKLASENRELSNKVKNIEQLKYTLEKSSFYEKHKDTKLRDLKQTFNYYSAAVHDREAELSEKIRKTNESKDYLLEVKSLLNKIEVSKQELKLYKIGIDNINKFVENTKDNNTDNLSEENWIVSRIKNVNDSILKLNNSINEIETKLDLYKKVKTTDGNKCGFCGLTLAEDSCVTDDIINGLIYKKGVCIAKLEKKQSLLMQLEGNYKHIIGIKTKIEQEQNILHKLEEGLDILFNRTEEHLRCFQSGLSEEEYTNKLEELNDNLDKFCEYHLIVSKEIGHHETIGNYIDNMVIDNKDNDISLKEYITNNLEEITKLKNIVYVDHYKNELILSEYNSNLEKKIFLENKYNNAVNAIDKLNGQHSDIDAAIYNNNFYFHMYQVEEKLEENKQNYYAYNELSEKLTDIKITLRGLLKNKEDLVNKINKEYGVIKKIEQLTFIKNSLGKNGIISFMIGRLYDQIITVASSYLTKIAPNIVIRKERDTICGLEFIKTNYADADWLPSNKLSGGEKVKVGIAMIFALNTITIPDFGMVLLDEPSTHLCEDSINALLEMFSTGLKESKLDSFQTIVVDHSNILKSGFNLTHVIK